ncbi:MAG: hypothetical protein K0R57_5266 [Paenibacillaceae bacterium]|nr:hypothetical protein [Paenibacillaceae bacterium]
MVIEPTREWKGDVNLMQADADKSGIRFYPIDDFPFVITGFPYRKENRGGYNRVPERLMGSLRESLAWVAPQPSGGTIRFRTDSARLLIDAELMRNETSVRCTQAALSGFDVYLERNGALEFCSNLCAENNPLSFQAEAPNLGGRGMKNVVIYTPLQNPLKSVRIGLEEKATVCGPDPFAVAKPLLFYGSSITCGFCASRPGLTYPARVARELNADFINYGFGGNAKGDPEIARAIASLELSGFIMDYDLNAPCTEHLEQTHQAFFEAIRRQQPELPVIILSAPVYHKDPEYFGRRRQIVKRTYERAAAEGDRNVYFVDGEAFFPGSHWAEFTVDRTHPNDAGFMHMAQTILPVIKQALNM